MFVNLLLFQLYWKHITCVTNSTSILVSTQIPITPAVPIKETASNETDQVEEETKEETKWNTTTSETTLEPFLWNTQIAFEISTASTLYPLANINTLDANQSRTLSSFEDVKNIKGVCGKENEYVKFTRCQWAIPRIDRPQSVLVSRVEDSFLKQSGNLYCPRKLNVTFIKSKNPDLNKLNGIWILEENKNGNKRNRMKLDYNKLIWKKKTSWNDTDIFLCIDDSGTEVYSYDGIEKKELYLNTETIDCPNDINELTSRGKNTLESFAVDIRTVCTLKTQSECGAEENCVLNDSHFERCPNEISECICSKLFKGSEECVDNQKCDRTYSKGSAEHRTLDKKYCVEHRCVQCIRDAHCGDDELDSATKCIDYKCVAMPCEDEKCSMCDHPRTKGWECGLINEKGHRYMGKCIHTRDKKGYCTLDRCPIDYPWAVNHGLNCCKTNRDKDGVLLTIDKGECVRKFTRRCPYGICFNYFDKNEILSLKLKAVIDAVFIDRIEEHKYKRSESDLKIRAKDYIQKSIIKVNEIFSKQLNVLLVLDIPDMKAQEEIEEEYEDSLNSYEFLKESAKIIKHKKNKDEKEFSCTLHRYPIYSRCKDYCDDEALPKRGSIQERLVAFSEWVKRRNEKAHDRPVHWILFTGCDFNEEVGFENYETVYGYSNKGSFCQNTEEDVSIISFVGTTPELTKSITVQIARSLGASYHDAKHPRYDQYEHCKKNNIYDLGILSKSRDYSSGLWSGIVQFHPIHEEEICTSLHEKFKKPSQYMPQCIEVAYCNIYCTSEMLDNDICDWHCDNKHCNYDNGMCKEGTSRSCAPQCYKNMPNDGICDVECNTEECNFDGGDCEACSCEDLDFFTCWQKCMQAGDTILFAIAVSPMLLFPVLFLIGLSICCSGCCEKLNEENIKKLRKIQKRIKADKKRKERKKNLNNDDIDNGNSISTHSTIHKTKKSQSQSRHRKPTKSSLRREKRLHALSNDTSSQTSATSFPESTIQTNTFTNKTYTTRRDNSSATALTSRLSSRYSTNQPSFCHRTGRYMIPESYNGESWSYADSRGDSYSRGDSFSRGDSVTRGVFTPRASNFTTTLNLPGDALGIPQSSHNIRELPNLESPRSAHLERKVSLYESTVTTYIPNFLPPYGSTVETALPNYASSILTPPQDHQETERSPSHSVEI